MLPRLLSSLPLPLPRHPGHDPERGAAERQPLLPAPASHQPAQQHAPRLQGAAHPPRIRTDHVEQYRISQFGALWTDFTNHNLTHGGRLNVALIQRMIRKLAIHSSLITMNMAADVLSGVASAVVSREILSHLSGAAHSPLAATIMQTLPYVASRNPLKAAGNELGVEHRTALALLVLAGTYDQNQRGGQGMEFALATQLAAGTTNAIHAMVDLLRRLYPTRGEDLKAVYNAIMKNNQKVIAQMPEDRKESVEVLLNALDKSLVTPVNRGEPPNVDNAKALLEALDVHLQIWKNMQLQPENLWLYDCAPGETLGERKRIAALEEKICMQVSPNKSSQQAVRTFIERMRLQRSAKWDSAANDKTIPALNVLVAVGAPGTGKTYLGKLLADFSGEDAVEIGFGLLVEYLAPPDGMDTRGGSFISPYHAHSQFILVMLKSQTALVICNEADLVGMGDQGMGTNQKYVNAIKRAFDPNADGKVILEGHPQNTRYILDLRRTSFFLTTNQMPTDPALLRRFPIVEIDRIPMNARREAAKSIADRWMNDMLPRYFRTLSSEQMRAIKSDVDGLMEFIIGESQKDAGPTNMQMAIGEVFFHLARGYADGLRSVPAEQTGKTPPEMQIDDEHGPHWTSVPHEEIEQGLKDIIVATFKKHREGSAIASILERSRQELENKREKGQKFELPTATDYFKEAEQNKLTPKDTLTFVEKALRQQWEPDLEKKPQDFRRAFRALSTAALANVAYVYGSGDEARGGPAYKSAQFYLNFQDRIMRIPMQRKNISHWEAGGDADERARIHAALERIESLFSDRASKAAVREVLDHYIDSTLPDAGSTEGGDSVTGREVNTLFIHGPSHGGQDSVAKEIVKELGLRPVQMTVKKFLAMMRNTGREGHDTVDMTPDEALGEISELLRGEYMDAALVFSGEEINDLADDVKAELNSYLAPGAINPKVKVGRLDGASFTVEVTGLLKIFTMCNRVQDEGALKNARLLSMDQPSPEIQRRVAAATFEQQVARLDRLGLPLTRKAEIAASCAGVMQHIMDTNARLGEGPAMLERVIAALFSNEVRKAKNAILAKGKAKEEQEAEQSVGKPAAGGAVQEEQDALPRDWTHFAAAEPSQELVENVEALFEDFRQLAEEVNQSAGVHAIAPQASQQAPASGQDSGQPGASNGEEMVKRLLESLTPEQVQRAVRQLVEQAQPTRTTPAIPSSQQTIDQFYRFASSILLEHAESGSADDVARVLDSSNYVNLLKRRNAEGETVLHVAARSGNLEVARVLVNERRVVHAAPLTDNRGRTALHVAAEKGSGEVLELLLGLTAEGKHLFDVNATDLDNNTALTLAAGRGHDRAARVLLGHPRTDVNHANGAQQTALHLAILSGHHEVTKQLLGHQGLDRSQLQTATMLAVSRGDNELARSLLAMNGTQSEQPMS